MSNVPVVLMLSGRIWRLICCVSMSTVSDDASSETVLIIFFGWTIFDPNVTGEELILDQFFSIITWYFFKF